MATVRVPATSANLSPGFDCLGVAWQWWNEFTLRERGDGPLIEAEGDLPRDETNLAWQAVLKLFAAIDRPVPDLGLAIRLSVPTARGLGSSSTAIVGGFLAANAWAGHPLSRPELLALAVEMEGHPDNVAPALLGGCRLSTDRVCVEIPWPEALMATLAVPAFELPTDQARAAIPAQVPLPNAVFNLGRTGLLVHALSTGRLELLRVATEDRLHQDHRAALVPGLRAVLAAALEAGARGAFLSGAGPTLAALVEAPAAPAVQEAMRTAWQRSGIQSRVVTVKVDAVGAHSV